MRLIAALVFCLLNIPVHAKDCVASVYAVGDSSQPGTKTASGIPFDDNGMTAAHKSLPFGSKVKVTNKKSGDAVTVTITDRGPYVKGRCIDLSKASARALGFAGLVPVSVVPVVSD
jgi:rare lipoprotein A